MDEGGWNSGRRKDQEFLEQSERIYQAGKDAMDELKAAYPQAFDDSEQPVYGKSWQYFGRNCRAAFPKL